MALFAKNGGAVALSQKIHTRAFALLFFMALLLLTSA